MPVRNAPIPSTRLIGSWAIIPLPWPSVGTAVPSEKTIIFRGRQTHAGALQDKAGRFEEERRTLMS